MTRKELATEYSNLVHYVYHNKIGSGMKKRYKDQYDDAIQEGMLGLMMAIDKWNNSGIPYDTPMFRSCAIKYIQWKMLDFYKFRTNHFKLTSFDYKEDNLAATNRLLNNSFSLDQKVINDEGNGTEMYNFLGETVDDYDGIFYAELEKFLQLIPEDEREIMRCYYYSNIEMYEAPDLAIAVTAKQLSVSTGKIRSISKKWNDELYAYLHSEKETLLDIHQRFEDERHKTRIEQYQQKRERKCIAIVKDGVIRHVKEHVIDKYIAEGWVEPFVERDGAKRVKKYYVNNGKVAFRVFEGEIQKFLDIGFVRGSGKGIVPPNSGKCIYINNGYRTVRIYENCLEYWNAVGYQAGTKKAEQDARKNMLTGYVQLRKGDNNIRVPEDEVEQYLASGWSKGSSKVKICNLDGEIKTICKDELEKYLSEDWVLFGTSKLAREQQKKDKQNPDKILIHNDMTETYIDRNKLELFQQHGWKTGTVWIRVHKPGMARKKGERRIPVGQLPEYLAKGYTQ